MTNYLKKGFFGIIFVFSASTLANFFGYLVRLILARNITPTELGLFYSAYTIVTFILLFITLGLHTSVIKHLAEFKANKEYLKTWFTFKLVLIYRLVSGLLAGIFLILFSEILEKYYFKNQSSVEVLFIFSFTIIFIVIIAIISSLFQGFQKLKLFSAIIFTEKFFFLIAIVTLIFLDFKRNALLPAYAILFGTIFTSIVFFPFLFKFRKYFHKGPLDKIKVIKKIFSFGIASFMISLGNIIIGYIDTIIITIYRPLSEVGIYNVILPTVIIVGFLSRSISQVFFPMVSELNAKKLYSKLNQGLSLLHNYSLLIVIPLAITMFVFPEFIIKLLFGPEYITGSLAMQILSIGVIFFTLGTIDQSVISGIGKPKIITQILLLASVFNVIANILLIPIFGMNAAALTTTISYFIIMKLTLNSLKNNLNFQITSITWIKFTILSIILTGFMYLIKYLIFNPYIGFIIAFVVGILIYFILATFLNLFNLKEFISIFNKLIKK